MKRSYALAYKLVLKHEGGKVNHPDDPGGRTNKGVIQRVYDGYRRRKGLSLRSVYQMTDAEAAEIYREQYWKAIRGDELPNGVDYCVFDGAVNSGPVQSIKWLQRALGMNRIDGQIGEATLAAIDNCDDHDRLVREICHRRLVFLRQLKTFPTFGRGWTARVNGVERVALQIASGARKPEPAEIPQDVAEAASAKAPITDAKKAPQTATADLAAGGGAVGTPTVAATIDSTKDALTPLAGSSKWADVAIMMLVVAGAAITVGGVLWALYARKKRKERLDALDLEPELA
jgi:lysozyme family protein